MVSAGTHSLGLGSYLGLIRNFFLNCFSESDGSSGAANNIKCYRMKNISVSEIYHLGFQNN